MTFLHDLLRFPFLQYAVLAGALAAVAAGVVGSLVVVRRTTYLAGAISHCVLAGLGLARYLQRACGVEWFTPMLGAALAAVAAAALISWLTVRYRQRTDTALSMVWAVGMAIGVSFLAATPGYQDDLMSYLFGSLLLVDPSELAVMAGLDVLVLALVGLFYNQLLAIGFHADHARLRGVRVALFETGFLMVTALTVVLLVKVSGIVLALALLTLPAATAGLLVRRLVPMMAVSAGICFVVTTGGLALSYGPEWPPGATIVEVAAAAYLLAAGVRHVRGMMAQRFQRASTGNPGDR
ncbi:MAG: metal ABC transporter permease [bacterium]